MPTRENASARLSPQPDQAREREAAVRFMIEYRYEADKRESILRAFKERGLSDEPALKVLGAWVAIETGLAYVLAESKDAVPLYEACSEWSDHGSVKVTPVISLDQIP